MFGIRIATSTIEHGSMKRTKEDSKNIERHRSQFLTDHNTTLEQTVLVQVDYNSRNFCRYDIVDQLAAGEGMCRPGRVADGLATNIKGLGLFLPLADCNGVVLHDPAHHAIMLTHLGRHNLEQYGGTKSVRFMVEHYGSDPAKLLAYFSPSAGEKNYPLYAFDNQSIAATSREQLLAGGILPEHISDPGIDTTVDERFFSHSEFLRGRYPDDGRFAVLAMLSD